MEITLDFQDIESREELHAYLQRRLQLPDYYGKNLDALHDCLSERQERYCMRVEHLDSMRERFGDYADSLIQVFCDSGSSVLINSR